MDFELIVDVFFHVDQYLNALMEKYPVYIYGILFTILFLETGAVVTPFLPGDSILFAVGALAASNSAVHIPLLLILLCSAAILGDTVNYKIGNLMRGQLRKKKKIRFIKTEHIQKTQAFFERHGGKTITIARFVPIVRTFAPFVAGASKMDYKRFFLYNVIGGLSWVLILFGIGFFMGNMPMIQDNFYLVTIGIIVISMIPVLVSFIQSKRSATKQNLSDSSCSS